VDRTSAAATNASLAAERDAVARERDGLRSERDSIMVERDAATSALRHAELRAQASTTRLEAINESQEQVKETFAQLSNEALQRSNTQFLEMADSRFKLAGAPIAESLTKVEHQLGEIEKDRAGAQRALVQHLESVQKTGEALRAETSSLVSALRKPQARGRWGELQLRRCVEHAGMTDRCDFTEQTTVTTSDGVLRPDMIIKLVGGKSIVVDSKVTLSAFLEAYETDDDAVREERLGAHARHLRQHVDSLAGKAYWSQFSPAPEFVVLFVPSDALLAAALDRDGALIDDAFGKRIHIATPTTLISVLRAVAYAWQQEALATNAQEVFELGREMYKRLGVMGDHMDKLGRSLTGAVKAYNGTVGSLEKNVLVTARKLNALEVVDTELDTPAAVEEPVRTLGATELVTAAEDARTVVALPPATEATPALELEGRPEDYGIDLGLPPDTIGRRTGS
jgi:DNA recombination protein RmuC